MAIRNLFLRVFVVWIIRPPPSDTKLQVRERAWQVLGAVMLETGASGPGSTYKPAELKDWSDFHPIMSLLSYMIKAPLTLTLTRKPNPNPNPNPNRNRHSHPNPTPYP